MVPGKWASTQMSPGQIAPDNGVTRRNFSQKMCVVQLDPLTNGLRINGFKK